MAWQKLLLLYQLVTFSAMEQLYTKFITCFQRNKKFIASKQKGLNMKKKCKVRHHLLAKMVKHGLTNFMRPRWGHLLKNLCIDSGRIKTVTTIVEGGCIKLIQKRLRKSKMNTKVSILSQINLSRLMIFWSIGCFL